MNEYMCLYFIRNEDKKLTGKYSKSKDINEFSFMSVKKIHIRILISGYLAHFSTVVS